MSQTLLDPATALAGPYEPTWTSLRRHQTPAWLIDAKFGIYCHWGIRTIQYLPGNAELSDEQALERFTAKAFDPAAWAELFQAAGARFAGPIAWHGSPLLHWDSRIRDYNTVQRNPHRDIVGELRGEVRARGMKFIASFHSISDDGWLGLAQEAVDKYLPDVFWVDASFGGTKQAHHLKIIEYARYLGRSIDSAADGRPNPGGHPPDVLQQLSERYQRRFLAHYFNRAAERGREVEFVYKSHDVPPGVGMRDLENGLLNQTAYDVWMTDLDMNQCPDWETHGWFFREGIPLRSASNIIRVLTDVVSKNGILLLNVPPRADGGFTPEVRGTLEAVGRWLEVHGEAIYGASPWHLFGEGPTTIGGGDFGYHHNDHFGRLAFTPDDVRFTTNGSSLYATCLGRPRDRLTVRAFNTAFKFKPGTLGAVDLLGHDGPLAWTHDERGLTIDLPAGLPLNDHANVFKIKTA